MQEIIIPINPDLCTPLLKEALGKVIDSAVLHDSEFVMPEHLLEAVICQQEFKDRKSVV